MLLMGTNIIRNQGKQIIHYTHTNSFFVIILIYVSDICYQNVTKVQQWSNHY